MDLDVAVCDALWVFVDLDVVRMLVHGNEYWSPMRQVVLETVSLTNISTCLEESPLAAVCKGIELSGYKQQVVRAQSFYHPGRTWKSCSTRDKQQGSIAKKGDLS